MYIKNLVSGDCSLIVLCALLCVSAADSLAADSDSAAATNTPAKSPVTVTPDSAATPATSATPATAATPAPAASQAAPALSRRRELGEASARSLLMTVLGEYVLPRTDTVWTFTLVRALAMLGVEEKSARQALARSAAEGWVASQRHGRRVRWQLTEPGRRLLSEGASRIYSFGRQRRRWDQRWLILLVSVPDGKRRFTKATSGVDGTMQARTAAAAVSAGSPSQ